MGVTRTGTMRRKTWALIAAAVATAHFARDAHAAGPLDVEAAALIGGGTLHYEGANALGFGLGARAGIAAYGFYTGLSAFDYLGGTGGSDDFGMGGSLSVRALLFGIELGYGPRFGPVTLRGRLGLGDYAEIVDTHPVNLVTGMAEAPGHVTSHYLYLEPGVTLTGSTGLLLLGADANLLWLGTGPQPFEETGFALDVQVGITL
jgi:hypothetical protein